MASDRYRGLSIDFEEIPLSAQPGFRAFIEELVRAQKAAPVLRRTAKLAAHFIGV